jgi:FHS family glucose/mannose:H+ symporter-like MFS transporter
MSYFLIGMSHVVLGSVLQELLLHYNRDYRDGGLLVALQFAGFLVGVLIGPLFMKKLGPKSTILICVGCVFAAEMTYLLLPPWYVFLQAAPLAGFGFGMVEAVVGALTIKHLRDKAAKVMTRLEFFFGAGALVMPALAGVLIATDNWRWTFSIVVLVALSTFVGWAGTALSMFPSGSADHSHDNMQHPMPSRTSTRSSVVIMSMFILLFIVYVGLEMSLVNFLPSIMSERSDISVSMASFAVTGFWVAMCIGRLVVGSIAVRLGYLRFLMISIGLAGIVFGAFALTGQASVIYAYGLVFMLGLVLSGVFAVGLLAASEYFQGKEERTTSLLIGSGGIGGIVLPLVTGWLMDRTSTEVTTGFFTLYALVMLAIVLVIFASTPRVGREKLHSK